MNELTTWLQDHITDCDRNLVNLRHHAEVVCDGDDGGPTVAEEESFKSALEFVMSHIKNDN